MGSLQPSHWIILAVIVVLLFGARKLPDLARGLGQSMRIFKSEVKEMQKDDAPADQARAELPAAPVEAPRTGSTDDVKKSA